ncbi:MAG: T9SS type A sorting domain-containing protein [bacterium]|nr:T9SS type A sorting domain-containing protein [bacterium]
MKKILAILFLLMISILKAEISISAFLVDDGSLTSEKINNQNPAIQVSISDNDTQVDNIRHIFSVDENTAYLWHFNQLLDSSSSFAGNSGNTPPLTLDSEGMLILSAGTIVADSFEKSIYSNGNTEYVLSHETLFQIGITIGTIEFWFKPLPSITTTQYLIYQGNDLSGDDIFTVKLSSETQQLEWITSGGTLTSVKIFGDEANSEWHYLAFLFDESTKEIFINGVLDSSAIHSGSIAGSTNSFRVCGRGAGGNDSFQGYFDELRISTTTKSEPEQVLANYGPVAYAISTDAGTTWREWQYWEYDSAVASNSGIISFPADDLPSSLTQNIIKIMASNTLNEYTTAEYVIKVDTIPPQAVIGLTGGDPTENNQVKIQWTEPNDAPDTQAIVSYKVYYSMDATSEATLKSGVMPNPPATRGIGETITASIADLLPETSYYVSVLTNDGLQDSILETTATVSSGLKPPTAFQGVAKSSVAIQWSWIDNSAVELGYEISNSEGKVIVASTTLTANTTFYLEEEGLAVGREYTRYLKAVSMIVDENDDTQSISSESVESVAETFASYNLDITGDGNYDLAFSPNDNFVSFNDNATFKGYDGLDRIFYAQDTEVFVWFLDVAAVAVTKIVDVDGDGEDDYLYQNHAAAGASGLRYFDVLEGVDRSIGTLAGIVLDQYGNPISGVSVSIAVATSTLKFITDSQGEFASAMPITKGEQTRIITTKLGYSSSDEHRMLYNSEENNVIVLIRDYALNVLKDDIHTYPNPFSKSQGTNIVYNVRNDSSVEILVYDVKGKMVEKLVDENKVKGGYSRTWQGRGLSKGIYYLFYKTADSKLMKKVVIK